MSSHLLLAISKANTLINKIPRHDKDINWIKKKIGDNEAFAKTFSEAAKESVTLEQAISQLIDKHDNHKIKMSALALGKWAAAIFVGGVITWLAAQALIIPQYNLRIDELQNQIEDLRQ